jgi:hypothetical protein
MMVMMMVMMMIMIVMVINDPLLTITTVHKDSSSLSTTPTVSSSPWFGQSLGAVNIRVEMIILIILFVVVRCPRVDRFRSDCQKF